MPDEDISFFITTADQGIALIELATRLKILLNKHIELFYYFSLLQRPEMNFRLLAFDIRKKKVFAIRNVCINK